MWISLKSVHWFLSKINLPGLSVEPPKMVIPKKKELTQMKLFDDGIAVRQSPVSHLALI